MIESICYLIDEYAVPMGDTVLYPMIFLFNVILLLIFVLGKCIVELIINKDKAKKQKVLKQYIGFRVGRDTLSFLFAIVVSSSIIVLTGCNKDNLILNYFLSPIASFLLSFWFDSSFLGQVEQKYGYFKNPLSTSSEEKTIAKESTPVSVVINNNGSNTKQLEGLSFEEITEKDISQRGVAYYFNLVNKEMKKNESEMEKQSEILGMLREERLAEKAIILEDLMYEALNQGFATPEQDKEIRRKYHVYRDVLGGNHEIKDLYEQRYLKLNVHKERRVQNIPVAVERRSC